MFITPDPMMSGLNHDSQDVRSVDFAMDGRKSTYAYACCNPVMYSDPTGLEDDDEESEAVNALNKAPYETTRGKSSKKKDDGKSEKGKETEKKDFPLDKVPKQDKKDDKQPTQKDPGKHEGKDIPTITTSTTSNDDDDDNISFENGGGDNKYNIKDLNIDKTSEYANKYIYVDKNMKINIVEDNDMSFNAYKPPFWAEIPGAKLLGDLLMLFRMDNYNPITNWSYLPGDAQDVRDSLRVDAELTILSFFAGPIIAKSSFFKIEYKTQGNNIFKAVNKTQRWGFRIDPAHKGHMTKGFYGWLNRTFIHSHFWRW